MIVVRALERRRRSERGSFIAKEEVVGAGGSGRSARRMDDEVATERVLR